jgi:hypothetical protein
MGNSQQNCGYRTVDVQPGSPADQAGLVSYLDFIIAANGVALDKGDQLTKSIGKSEDCKLSLKVYNALHSTTRDVVVVPSRRWGGDSLLGASIRYESWEDTEYLRVVTVVPNSPASKCGLRPETDYILGTIEGSLTNIDQLASEVLQKDSITLFVLDRPTGKVRKIVAEVKAEDGSHFLGCDVATGLFHSPEPQQEPKEATEEPAKPAEPPIVSPPKPQLAPVSHPPLTLGGVLPQSVPKVRSEFAAYILKPPPPFYRLPSTIPFQPLIKESPYVVMEENSY